MNSRNKIAGLGLCAAIIIALFAVRGGSEVSVKLRDLAYIDGFRENQILGYGLVVGLAGTGDTKSDLTNSSISNLLKNLGLDSEETFRSKNSAAVLLTASLPPFARPGDRVDVTVSSIHNAKSLEGGILVQSPLKGADNAVYAVAQGPLTAGRGAKDSGAVKTVARITGGALVERTVEPEYIYTNDKNKDRTKGRFIGLVLKTWDFTVANQVLNSVKELYPVSEPSLDKGGKILLKIPDNVPVTEFISKIEELELTPNYGARVVINERDGTIVMGGDVKISEVMVSREGITVKVEGKSGQGKGQGDISGKTGSAVHMRDAASVKDLVDSLNYMGASTKDTIAIIKALKDAGALHAELIVK
jgi:flagellar P-ring protein precursor FlgI